MEFGLKPNYAALTLTGIRPSGVSTKTPDESWERSSKKLEAFASADPQAMPVVVIAGRLAKSDTEPGRPPINILANFPIKSSKRRKIMKKN